MSTEPVRADATELQAVAWLLAEVVQLAPVEAVSPRLAAIAVLARDYDSVRSALQVRHRS